MPFMHEWMLHHPSDWTPAQAGAYTQHTFQQLTHALVPTNQALGASRTAGILLGVVALVARANPLAARDICVQMANAFELIDDMDPLKGASAN